MKVDIWYILFIIIAAVIIAFALKRCERRDDMEAIAYHDSLSVSRERIKALERALVTEKSKTAEIESRHVEDSIRIVSYQRVSNRDNKALRAAIADIKASIQPLLDSIPEFQIYDSAKDSLIIYQQSQIDTLSHYVQIEQRTSRDLILSAASASAINDRITAELKNRAAIAEARVDKLERRARRQWIKTTGALILGGAIVWIIKD